MSKKIQVPKTPSHARSAQEHVSVHGSPMYYKDLQFLSSSTGAHSRLAKEPEDAEATAAAAKKRKKRKKRNFTHAQVDAALKNELKGATITNYPSDNIINYMFSDKKLGVPVKAILEELSPNKEKKRKRRLLYENGHWIHVPKLDKPTPKQGEREFELGAFLLQIAKESRKGHEDILTMERSYTSDFNNTPLDADSGIQRMPDLIGLKSLYVLERRMRKKKKHTRLTWEFIDLLVELKCGKNATWEQLYVDLTNKAYCMFQAQINRQFICCLAFKQFEARFLVFDRSGVIRSSIFNIHESPLLFLRVVIGLTWGKDSLIGLDSTLRLVDGEVGKIWVKEIDYDIESLAWRGDMIRGRATTCLLVVFLFVYYVIKDTWIRKGRAPTEIYFLNKAKHFGVEGIPKLIASMTVKIDGQFDICSLNRGPCDELEDRVHRRYLFEDCGVPITHFASQRELLSAFIDCITAHRDLLKKARILHRDISVWNLMLKAIYNNIDKAKSTNGLRKGLLIDLDYVLDLDLKEGKNLHFLALFDAEELEFITNKDAMIVLRHRTGTRPCMAHAILRDLKTDHNEHHDLESFFYVFIYICVLFNGPNGSLQKRRCLPKFLKSWITLPYSEVGLIKVGLIHSPEDGLPNEVVDNFTPYFKNLLGLAAELRKACARNANHDEFIDILKGGLAKLPETDPKPGPPPPAEYKRYGTFDGEALRPDLPEKADPNPDPNPDQILNIDTSSSGDEDDESYSEGGNDEEGAEKSEGILEKDKLVHASESDENPFLDNLVSGKSGPSRSVPVASGRNVVIAGNFLPIVSLDEAISQLNSVNLNRGTRVSTGTKIATNTRPHPEAQSPDKVHKNTRLQNRPLLPKPDFTKKPPI